MARHAVFGATGIALSMLSLVAVTACKRDAPPAPAATTSSGTIAPASAAAPAAVAPDPTGCVVPTDLLVPFASYEHNDLFRNIAVDGTDVVFRNYKEVFRVPLAGGAPTSLAKMPGGLMNAPLWVAGDRILSQSPGEPIFMALPKGGGSWSTVVDASTEKLGGGRSVVTRILHDVGTGKKASFRALDAVFDGAAFYFIEQSGSLPTVNASRIRKIALAGGDATTLYEWNGKLEGLEKAGDRLAFFQRDPVKSPATSKKVDSIARAMAVASATDTPSSLMTLPVAGGKPIVRVAGLKGTTLLADGATLYVTGYLDGDLSKPGVFRVPVDGTAPPEQIDFRHLSSPVGMIYGDRLAFVGIGLVQRSAPGVLPVSSHLVLTGARSGGSLERSACLAKGYGVHAEAVTGKTLLLSVFRQQDRQAAIARLPLP